MKLKIDENIPNRIQNILIEAGFDTHSVFDESIQGTDDTTLIKLVSDEKRILVTLDLDFSNITIYPPNNYHGIIVLRPKSQDIKSISILVEKIIPMLKLETIKNHLWIVENDKIRIKGEDY